jgi:membrane-associated phospholipid phosphatase
VVLATLVTIFYKISVHSMAIWGLIGILFPLNKVSEDGALFYPTIIAIILAGVIMAARLQLQVHSPREMMVGGVLGFGATFISMIILF